MRPALAAALALTAAAAAGGARAAGSPPKGALSVLFIVIDDLRTEFNVAYGQKRLVTPNIDKFAAEALTFTRAYVQYSHCSPSRNCECAAARRCPWPSRPLLP